jgi:hypothetical protein
VTEIKHNIRRLSVVEKVIEGINLAKVHSPHADENSSESRKTPPHPQ